MRLASHEYAHLEFIGVDENGCEVFKPFTHPSQREGRKTEEAGSNLVTNEWWAGNFNGNGLRMYISESRGEAVDYGTPRGVCRISIHGTDDFSLHYRDIPNRETALSILKRVPVPVTRKALLEMGFWYD